MIISQDQTLRRFLDAESAPTDTKAVDGIVEGYGCAFNVLDSYKTRFAPGCFSKSISQWRSMTKNMPIYVNHSDDRPYGGWVELTEDSYGLRTVGQIVTAERDYIAEMFGMKVVMGESIGFSPVAWTVEPDDTVTFTEVKLREISLVTANSVPGSVIDSIRSGGALSLPATKREFEHLLRQVGFSANAAKSITSGGFRETEARDEPVTDQPTDLRDGADQSGLLKGLQDQLTLMRLENVARRNRG